MLFCALGDLPSGFSAEVFILEQSTVANTQQRKLGSGKPENELK